MRTYRIISPYIVIKDAVRDLDRSAALAGVVKSSHEELQRTVASIARLTSVVAPEQERRARELVDIMIKAKRAYVAAEDRRVVHRTYEAQEK